MLENNQISKIKEATEEFFEKMGIEASNIEVVLSSPENEIQRAGQESSGGKDIVDINIKVQEPQILIGQQGQTLLEIQRLLRSVMIKKTQKVFYVNFDINNYKKNKAEHLRSLAKELADQVSLSKEPKVLSPMSSYERRIIHSELSQRTDIVTESQGEGLERHIVINPR